MFDVGCSMFAFTLHHGPVASEARGRSALRMTFDELFWRRAVVAGSCLVYWGGVFVQARRVRRFIGKSPNVKPRGTKEKFLWAGWLFVILVWLVQPLVIAGQTLPSWLRPVPTLLNAATLVCGLALLVGGYAGTLWCYAIMGSAWRMGINRKERNELVTRGLYGVVRHPIYGLQIVMLAGA